MSERTFVSVAGSETIYRFQDSCAVYLLRDGDRGLLIDLGSGAALDAAAAVGVTAIEAVVFTHAHRDQCGGVARAIERGIPVRFPEAARAFVDPEARTDLRAATPLLRNYPGRFLLPRPISGARFDVRPGSTIAWGPFDLEVVAAPGHLDHQVAYLVDDPDVVLDGASPRRVAFCGDAIHSRGKLHEPYHLETDHYTGAGARVGAESLRVLKQHRPNVLCPSHGPVTEGDLWTAFEETVDRLRRLAELKDTICPGRPAVRRLVRPTSGRLMPISEHLYVWNNSYFLLSDEGPVLMVDNAGELPESFWEQFRELPGAPAIEVVLVTHIHCDHVEGIEPLRARSPGLQAWAHEAIADLVEEPHRFRRPYLAEQGARIDRRLGEGETFTWREYTFRAHFTPGQTDYHAAYGVTIDGHRALLSGDNFYPAQQWGGTGGLSGLNGGDPLRGWRRSIDLVLALEPEWILASHIQPFLYRRADFEACRDWTEAVTAAMRDLAPDGCVERHHNPHWIGLSPYVQSVGSDGSVGSVPSVPSGTVRIMATIKNPYDRPVEATARLILPEGWGVEGAERRIEIAANGSATQEWRCTTLPSPVNEMVTLDVTFDGDDLGEIAECYVTRA